MKRFICFLLPAILVFAMLSNAGAEYLYDSWETVTPISDLAGDSTDPYKASQDILSIQHVFVPEHGESGVHYFRMDLAAAPEGGATPSFAGVYGFAIDTQAGGADGGESISYMPDEFLGIDFIIDAHYEPAASGFQRADYHENTGPTTFTFEDIGDVAGAFDGSNDSGTTLEWCVDDNDIGSPGASDFNWIAFTHDTGSCYSTYDTAEVPEPTTMMLAGAALMGLIKIRRRK